MNYSVIAEVGDALVKLLRNNMVPEDITSPESIGLCSPDEKGNIILGLFLYDLKECEEVRRSNIINTDSQYSKCPSTFLTLYFMITAYANEDIKSRSMQEHKLLGHVIQILGDNCLLDAKSYEPISKDHEYVLNIEMLQLSMEDKIKIWNVPNKAYKLSLFYKVTPVEIESTNK